MIVKTNSLIILMSNPIMSIPTLRITKQSTKNFLIFSFLKTVKIEFKMTLQSFFCLEFSIVPAKHNFLYLSLYISK